MERRLERDALNYVHSQGKLLPVPVFYGILLFAGVVHARIDVRWCHGGCCGAPASPVLSAYAALQPQ